MYSEKYFTNGAKLFTNKKAPVVNTDEIPTYKLHIDEKNFCRFPLFPDFH
jgi:hypothetical protein